LIAVWLWLPPKSPTPLWRFWLLIPGGVMLLGNLGLVIEASSSSTSYRHMARLAQLLAGAGAGALLLELAPALLSCVLIGFAIRKYWRQRPRSGYAPPDAA